MSSRYQSSRAGIFQSPMTPAQRPGRKNGRPSSGARWFVSHSLAPLYIIHPRDWCFHFPDLLHDLLEVVAGRALQRRERNVTRKLLQPQRLADRQHVPVIHIGGGRRSNRPAQSCERLVLRADGSLEGIAFDVDDLGPVIGDYAGIMSPPVRLTP